ncbi:hypothetical protein V3C99_017916 [Haemonchus contortus]
MAEVEYDAEDTLDFDALLIASDEEEQGTTEDEVDEVLRRTESDGSEEEDSDDESTSSWSSDISPHDPWIFSGSCGPDDEVLSCQEPIDFFELFLNDEILDLIVKETNRYGTHCNEDFQETDSEEMRRFAGLCLQMGMVKLPRLRDYWSSRPGFGGHAVASKIMARNRFEELLKYLHLADNENFDGDRLYKIKRFVQLFNKTAARLYSIGKEVCVDESLVPFRGRIVFRQYMPAKRHRYGIKLFKLCAKGGYTVRIKIYAGKDPSRHEPLADQVVLELMEGFLDEGRIVCTDNFYSSVGLAEKLISRRSHLVGTLRRNRKGIPKEIKETKLKRGQLCCKQKRNGVLVLKWRDKRDLYVISTKHDATVGTSQKPEVVDDYNEMKGFVDLSDQMASYTPFVRRTMKWYKRIFFHLITQTAVVNAWKLYKDVVKNIRLNDFKVEAVESLLNVDQSYTSSHHSHFMRHVLKEVSKGPKGINRRRCAEFYAAMSKEQGAAMASKKTKRVSTRCSKCRKFFCIDCFNKKHKSCRVET